MCATSSWLVDLIDLAGKAWRWLFPRCQKHGKPLIFGYGPVMRAYWSRKNQCWTCVAEEMDAWHKEHKQ